MSQNQRMILALVLSFVFFIGYDILVPKQAPVAPVTSVEKVQASNSISGEVPINTSTQAPQSAIEETKSAPVIESTIQNKTTLTTVKSKNFDVEFDQLGRISKFYLNGEKHIDAEGKRVQLFGDAAVAYPLEIRFSKPELNDEAFKVNYVSDVKELTLGDKPQTITFTQVLSTTTVTKKVTFYPAGNYTLNITLSNNENYYVTPGFRPSVLVDAYTIHGIRFKKKDLTLEDIEDGDSKGNERLIDLIVAAGSDRYYTTAFYDLEKSFDVSVSADAEGNPIIFTKGSSDFTMNGYMGVKEYNTLKSIDPKLTDIIEYGFFTFISKYVFLLLNWLHGILGNWGWAIVATTLLIRLVLYPLTYKGMVAMQKMKDLAPHMKELKEKYKGEPQKLNAKMMELYKKKGANPMGGCLPMILQIPVFFAIYRVLLNATELQHAPWALWITDLSQHDPYFVLPILMGGTMWYQQHVTPTTYSDPMQEKIMKLLPIIFTFFFIMFPAGLTLYWVVNNLFTIAQQLYINKLFATQREAKEVTTKD